MGEWNYNQYPPGYTWNNSGNNTNRQQQDIQYYQQSNNVNNTPQQYIGFQDFLHQFQQSNSFQMYPNNSFQNQYQNVQYDHRYSASRDSNPAGYQYQNPQRYHYGVSQNCDVGQSNNTSARNSRVPFENNQYHDDGNAGANRAHEQQGSSSNYNDAQHKNFNHVSNNQRSGPMHGENIVSKSKLTATASEFVPQSSRVETRVFQNNKTTPTYNEHSEPKESSNRRDIRANDSPSRNNRTRNSSSDFNRNTNWRRRDNTDESQSFTSDGYQQSGSSASHEDNSYHQNSEGNSRNRKDFYNNKTRYNNSENNNSANYYENNRPFRQAKTYNRQNSDNGNKYVSKKPTSYSSNETFRQKNNFKKNDQVVNRDNSQESDEYSNGAIRKNKNNFASKTYMKKEPDTSKDIDGTNVSQRERLIEQLDKGILECLVCCERIRQIDSVWSCNNCYHVLHLKCVIKWAKSSISEGAWRCPACQNNNSIVPSEYKCFCGKQNNPEWSRGGDSAHTCGSVCGRLPPSCLRHPCTLLCHPGPCPQCDAVVQKKCECGATSRSLRCSYNQPILCDNVCKKALNCQMHKCDKKCHAGSCEPCQLTVDQECYCPRTVKRTLPCDADSVGVSKYSCGEVCDKKLKCGNHECTKVCHSGECNSCELLPENVKMCPCGQTELKPEQKRESCLDPVPLCDLICNKLLNCGPPENHHHCKSPCHYGNCPPCPDQTQESCRCGHLTKNLKCIDLEKEKGCVRCGKKCSKKLSCGRHRCKILCCVDTEHRCMLPCNRNLTCGLHRCDDMCHNGHCDPCWRTSFDELRCQCGEAVRYPPIPCGTRPPACSNPCSLTRPCGHPPLHVCHPSPSLCPPCTVLTTRYCHGRHKMRKTIPCHQEDFSCGLPCGKDLSCTKHKCIEICHKGNCPTVCTQTCETERLACGHPCGGPCGHADPCPVSAPCKRPVRVTCSCGRRSATRACADHMKDLQRLQATAGMLAGAMGKPIDIKELIARGNTTVTLECDDECQIEERNRRLAIGLQIRNPDLSAKLTPRYSDFLKQYAGRDENFCNKIHEKLTELVTLAQNSKQKTRSHSFAPMNHQKRQFIHELCEHFGCESLGYGAEPYRNIVATAYREKSWLPALSLLEVIRRDKGQRKVPGPVMTVSSNAGGQQLKSSSGGAWSTLNTNYGALTLSDSTRPSNVNTSELEPGTSQNMPKPRIDYFDAPPED